MNSVLDSTIPEEAPGRTLVHVAEHECENCGAMLTGPFCSQCGQRHHEHPVHSLRHFLQEATEDLTHADSRLWLTLRALLFRPGLLTREFLRGRRARYLSPVRLYLVVSLLFFIVAELAATLAPSPPVRVVDTAHGFNMTVGTGRAAATATAPATGTIRGQAAQQHVCQQAGAFSAQVSAWFGRRVEHSCVAAMAAGGVERFERALQRNLERAMFLLLPLLAAAMLPLYRTPRRHYVEHLLFFLHNHACLFVVLGVDTVIGMITTSAVVRGAAALREFDRGGVEVDDASLKEFEAALRRENDTLKRALTDPRVVSGVGNAYSDEILHRARLSPFKQTRSLERSEVERLFESCRSVLTEWTDRLRSEAGAGFPGKVTAFRKEMAVHGRYDLPCPVCGTRVQRIAYAENECNYCPTCQTGGKLLADRALSRLLKGDWPTTVDELEEMRSRNRGGF